MGAFASNKQKRQITSVMNADLTYKVHYNFVKYCTF